MDEWDNVFAMSVLLFLVTLWLILAMTPPEKHDDEN